GITRRVRTAHRPGQTLADLLASEPEAPVAPPTSPDRSSAGEPPPAAPGPRPWAPGPTEDAGAPRERARRPPHRAAGGATGLSGLAPAVAGGPGSSSATMRAVPAVTSSRAMNRVSMVVEITSPVFAELKSAAPIAS